MSPAAATADIVDTLAADGRFAKLISALEAAGLDEALRGAGPFTVFAPTDDAFAALPAGTLDELLADPTGALTDVLSFHVVPEAALTTVEFEDGEKGATLLEDESVVVWIGSDDDFYVQSIKIVDATSRRPTASSTRSRACSSPDGRVRTLTQCWGEGRRLDGRRPSLVV